ncbi:MAG: LysR substrate-binding domain-containing protein [Pacificibacter sp.]|uniref:LysR substrate-binding domain-containing protein n=1 Tax=Pacificibacter sp. TaxID=1917866 RepID=UPI00321A105F
MKLPPLNAIKAFEATVRCGTFTAAGAELGVSSAAVSLQVSKAEEFLGKQLFLRGNNFLTTTDAGQMLYPHVARALSDLSEITERFLEQDMRSRIVISTIQSLAEGLVVPAVAKFRHSNPQVGVSLQIDSDPFVFDQHEIDLRVSFQDHNSANVTSQLLFQDTVAPICAPPLAQHLPPDLLDIPDRLLIHVDWGETYTSYPTWATWFRNFGNRKISDARAGLRVAGTNIGLELAIRGAGIMLAPLSLAQKAITAGQVTALASTQLSLPYGYYVSQNARSLSEVKPRKSQYLDHIQQLLKQAAPKP